jgi:hypothetical protein
LAVRLGDHRPGFFSRGCVWVLLIFVFCGHGSRLLGCAENGKTPRARLWGSPV